MTSQCRIGNGKLPILRGFPSFLAPIALVSSDDECFSLMEIMVQCVEDISPEAPFQAAWAALEPLLAINAALHRSTVEYWARLDTNEEEEMFRVSPNMRRLYMSSSEAANDI